MQSYREILFQRIDETQEAITVCDESNARLSGRELNNRVNALAQFLLEKGLAPADRISVQLSNGLPLVILYLACLKSRLVVIPLSPRLTAADFEHVINVTKPKLHVTEEKADGKLDSLQINSQFIMKLSCTRRIPATYNAQDLFLINFTSGTTEKPKAIVHRAESVLRNAEAFNDFLGYDSSQRMLHVMPMFYMAGILNTLLCPLFAGSTVVIGPQFSPRSALTIFGRIVEEEITAFWLSPSMIEMAMRLDRSKRTELQLQQTLKFALVGTASLSSRLAQEFHRRYGIKLLQSYGLSELLLLTVDKPDSVVFGSVGRSLPGVQMRIASSGELQVSTPYAFSGYLETIVDEEPKFRDSSNDAKYFGTGDIATITSESRISISGRIKEIIVVGGVNVSPLAIEDVLSGHTFVQQVAVVRADHHLLGEAPIAFIVLRKGVTSKDVEHELRAYAEAQLEPAARPLKYIFRSEMPVGPTGKIQKHFLPNSL